MRLVAAMFGASLAALSAVNVSQACTPDRTPREISFLETARNAAVVVRARVVTRGTISIRGRTDNTYVDIEVAEAFKGAVVGAKIRIWSNMGTVHPCPVRDSLAAIVVGTEGIFAIFRAPDGSPDRFRDYAIEYLVASYGVISQPAGRVRLRGLRYHRQCPFGCEYDEFMSLDDLRAEFRWHGR